ncbi:MAG: hypothetical protein Q4G64_08155 [bacterium]|nr:hypothetical protein [bacterium]
MRRWAGLAAAAALAVCAGCAPTDVGEPGGGIRVSGEVGAVPVVEFEAPLPLKEAGVSTLVRGDGPAVGEEDPVVVSLSSFHGQDGVRLEGAGEPQVLFVSPDDLGPLVHEAVVGAAEGSRFLVTQPVEEGDVREMRVTVVDLLELTPAEPGTLEGPVGVGVGDDGRPELRVAPDARPSGGLEVTQLARGAGEQVAPGQRVVLMYTVWTFEGAEVVDSTWTSGVPAVLDLDTAYPGVRTGLVDQRIGSRVLLEIPPDQGDGIQALVMVADVVAAY